MKLPNLDRLWIPERKITAYLLSRTHKKGRFKAIFFEKFGFNAEKWAELAAAFKTHAEQNDVKDYETTPLGIKYIVEGGLETPDGRRPTVKAVWYIDSGGENPRLITAFPGKKK